MSDQNIAAPHRAALDAGEGILRLAPTWVPRSFLMPGGRLKLASAKTCTPWAPIAAASTNAGSPRPPPPPTKARRPTRG